MGKLACDEQCHLRFHRNERTDLLCLRKDRDRKHRQNGSFVGRMDRNEGGYLR